MMEYTYNEFFSAVNKNGQSILSAINEHIISHYSEYKPFDIKPLDKSEKEWRIHYRKKPKTGKPICTVYSKEGKLSVQVCLLPSMLHEFLVRQNEFSDRIKNNVLKQAICAVSKSCRNYGGNNVCAWRQFYWVNKRLVTACPYPWIYFDNCEENDVSDIKLFLDIQAKHMVQNSKEIKGSKYAEENIQRCGEVRSIILDDINLDINELKTSNHVNKNQLLEKYTGLYNLVPMGEKDGLWFYFSDKAVCGLSRDKNERLQNTIIKGRYAKVIIESPFTFSLNRVWNYMCEWLQSSKETVKGCIISDNENTACFTRLFTEDSKDFMAVYIPISGA